MRTIEINVTHIVYRSEVRPDIHTTNAKLGKVIDWADTHPVVWKIVTNKRSKAFGVGSCVYIGWAQRSMAPEAILERATHFYDLIVTPGQREYHPSIFTWRAKFTFEHYQDKGFRGGFFQQHDVRYPRSCLTLDYTPETFDEVVDRFREWMANCYDTYRITLDGRTIRQYKAETRDVCPQPA